VTQHNKLEEANVANVELAANVATSSKQIVDLQDRQLLSQKQNTNITQQLTTVTAQNVELQSRPMALGIQYKAKTKDVDAIMTRLQVVLTDIQLSNCNLLNAAFVKSKDDLISKFPQKTVSCAAVFIVLDDSLKSMPADLKTMNPKLTDTQIKKITDDIKNLYTFVIGTLCVDGNIDKVKLDKLMTDILDSICYS